MCTTGFIHGKTHRNLQNNWGTLKFTIRVSFAVDILKTFYHFQNTFVNCLIGKHVHQDFCTPLVLYLIDMVVVDTALIHSQLILETNLFHMIPVPSTIGNEHIVSLCLSVHKINPLCACHCICLSTPSNVHPCPHFSTDTHHSYTLYLHSCFLFPASIVLHVFQCCVRPSQLPPHPSLLVMVMVAAWVIYQICCGGWD